MNSIQLLAMIGKNLAKSVIELTDVVASQDERIETLETQLTTLQRDMSEVLETTGIEFARWRKLEQEKNTQFIQTRVKYWRENGYGMQEAGKMAVQDLKDMHQSTKQTQVTE